MAERIRCVHLIPLLLLLATVSACDEPAPTAPAQAASPAERGAVLYASYCADCHGPSARGDGPLAAGFQAKPKDLSLIAARNGDLFVGDAVAKYIDGRELVEAHGPRDMPVWGRQFDDRNQEMREELRMSPDLIAAIVAYIRTLQRREASTPSG